MLTEPMTLTQLRRYFPVGKNKIKLIVNKIAGKEQHGRHWRLPVSSMPPKYQVEKGLIRPE